MKRLKTKLLVVFLLATIPMALFYSCDSNSDEDMNDNPQIAGVYKYAYVRPSENAPIDYSAPLDSLTTVGYSGISYLVRGTGLLTAKKITVNGMEIDFNPTLVTNNQIFIVLPAGVPYSNDSTPNDLRIETAFGEIATPFIIGQPYPTISAQPLALIGGETVTIKGSDFNNLEEVRFGTIIDGVDNTVMGEIISFDEKNITVKVPDVIPSTGNIFVKTPGGTAAAPVVYGADYPLFEESELFNDWSWCPIHEPSTEQVRDGVYSEKLVFNGWDALYMNLSNDPFNNPIVLSDYKYLKISFYSATNTTVRIFMDWDANSKKDINIAEGKWTDYLIPVSEISNNLTGASGDFVIQEFTGSAGTVYVDSVGFIK